MRGMQLVARTRRTVSTMASDAEAIAFWHQILLASSGIRFEPQRPIKLKIQSRPADSAGGSTDYVASASRRFETTQPAPATLDSLAESETSVSVTVSVTADWLWQTVSLPRDWVTASVNGAAVESVALRTTTSILWRKRSTCAVRIFHGLRNFTVSDGGRYYY